MSTRQLALFGAAMGLPMERENLAAVDIQRPPAPAADLPPPLSPEQAHLERYVCPVCNLDGESQHCFCEGVGHIDRKQAQAFLVDFPDLPVPRRLDLPPVSVDESCDDCAFRPDSQKHGSGAIEGIKKNGPFYCHQGMPVDGAGRYRPLCQTPRGEPIGHPLCAAWLGHIRRQLDPERAVHLNVAAHQLALRLPGLTAELFFADMGLVLASWPEKAGAWMAYRHATRALAAAPQRSPGTAPQALPGYPAAWSPCRSYRYVLWRAWAREPYMVVIGLNPSTADENTDDPTLRRCIAFAKREGYGSLAMVNLFAFRATKPRDMMAADDPVGPECDAWLRQVCAGAAIVVAAWGGEGMHAGRSVDVEMMLGEMKIAVRCFGYTQAGQPKHPLYLAGDTPLRAYLKP